jgi:hypothetical protein
MYVDGIKTILAEIRAIQISLLQKGKEMKEDKTEYFKKKTARFLIPPEFPRTDEYFAALVEDMYKELLEDAPSDADSVGMWIEYDTITLDRAMSLSALESIRSYSSKSPDDQEMNVAYELFKMTLNA